MIVSIFAILVALVSVILCFFSLPWGWGIWGSASILLVVNLKLMQFQKYKTIPELSREANMMLQKFGHFYTMQHGSNDFASASATMQMTGVVLAVISAFYGFWFGIGIALIAWLVMAFTARGYNPTNYLQPHEKFAHEEVIEWIQKKRIDAYQNRMKSIKNDSPESNS